LKSLVASLQSLDLDMPSKSKTDSRERDYKKRHCRFFCVFYDNRRKEKNSRGSIYYSIILVY